MCKNKMKTFGYKNRIEKENKITIENKKSVGRSEEIKTCIQ